MLGSVQKRRMLVACAAVSAAVSVAATGSAFAQTQPATPAPPATPSYSSSPIQMPTVIPSKSETAPSAFTKLAGAGATYVSKEQADKLDGFDRAFSEADRDKDGKLTSDEFVLAWAIYTGKS